MKTRLSEFYCTGCGNKAMPIQRKESKLKKSGHLKKLYCIYCRREMNCCEIRPYSNSYILENFRNEFESGVFINGLRNGVFGK